MIYVGGRPLASSDGGMGGIGFAVDPATAAVGIQAGTQIANKVIDNLGQGLLRAFGIEDAAPPPPQVIVQPAGPPWGLILGGGAALVGLVLLLRK